MTSTLTKVVNVSESSHLNYALKYAALGWHVFPLVPKEKKPLTRKGFHDATTEKTQIHQWWTKWPQANIGISMGEVSGVFALDIDPRNQGDTSLEALVAKHGSLPASVEAITGGGGNHYLFKYPKSADIPKQKLATGIDVQSDGSYIVVEPSLHPSGIVYAWEGSSDPLEGVEPVDAPDWLLKKLIRDKQATPSQSLPQGTGYLPVERVKDIRAALSYLSPDDYHDWINVGMALHSTNVSQQAFGVWTEWSQLSEKYDPAVQRKKWASFNNARSELNIESIFFWASERGWVNTAGGVLQRMPPQPIKVRKPLITQYEDVPDTLYNPPGILKDIVVWANKVAPLPQPLLAVQGALALGSVVTGRLYRTNRNNYSSLYFLNVAKSSAGKEFAKTIVEEILAEAGLDLVKGSGYTSSAAVVSALYDMPTHITIIDELGRNMASTKASLSSHRSDAITTIMEAFTRCSGVLRGGAYATQGLSEEQKKAMKKNVQHPALSILAMTTPKSFYDSLTSDAVMDGFLGRFLVMEADRGRQLTREVDWEKPPAHIIEWVKRVRAGSGGNLEGVTDMPETAPEPIVLTFSYKASKLFRDLNRHQIDVMDGLDEEGLDAMAGRMNEMAMRLSLVCALAENPNAHVISGEVAKWCIEYVRYAMNRLIQAVRENVSDNKDDAQIKRIVGFIRDAQKYTLKEYKHVTESGIMPRRYLMKLAKMKARDLDEYLRTAIESGLICRAINMEGERKYNGEVYFVPEPVKLAA